MESTVPNSWKLSTPFTSYPHPTVFKMVQRESIVNKVLLVGLGGCLGSIARYWLRGMTYKRTGPGFPIVEIVDTEEKIQ